MISNFTKLSTVDTDAIALEGTLSVEKARVLLADVYNYFLVPGCGLPGFNSPTVETMDAIREDFHVVATKLALLENVLTEISGDMKRLASPNVVVSLED